MNQPMTLEDVATSWKRHTAASAPCSESDMHGRIARWGDIPASDRAFVDTYIPGHERTLFSVIGSGVTDDPAFRPKIATAENFHVDYIVAPQGSGAALHCHDSEEVFFIHAGRWELDWLDGATGTLHTTMLAPRDLVSVPPHVHRAFRSVDGESGMIVSILGGKTPSPVKWDASVAAKATARGAGFDAAGAALKVSNLAGRGTMEGLDH
ncbi:MAG: cupin domain-containing protein [Hyphomicrobium sp.]|nr:cupin domain-containing protein [Hyphomicrobium sp.]